MAIDVPTFALAKVKVGVPVSVTLSVAWTPDSEGEAGSDTLPVASVVPSYARFDAVYVPTMVSVRAVMLAVPVAVVFQV